MRLPYRHVQDGKGITGSLTVPRCGSQIPTKPKSSWFLLMYDPLTTINSFFLTQLVVPIGRSEQRIQRHHLLRCHEGHGNRNCQERAKAGYQSIKHMYPQLWRPQDPCRKRNWRWRKRIQGLLIWSRNPVSTNSQCRSPSKSSTKGG